jgi:hypothetical protein
MVGVACLEETREESLSWEIRGGRLCYYDGQKTFLLMSRGKWDVGNKLGGCRRADDEMMLNKEVPPDHLRRILQKRLNQLWMQLVGKHHRIKVSDSYLSSQSDIWTMRNDDAKVLLHC